MALKCITTRLFIACNCYIIHYICARSKVELYIQSLVIQPQAALRPLGQEALRRRGNSMDFGEPATSIEKIKGSSTVC
jgi:hypothetical protein